MTACDVAVIGGGPAGCSAAVTLAAAGVRVVLLEAGTYPRSKVCGEFLSPEGAATLESLGVMDLVEARGPARITTALITAPGGASRRLRLPGAALGISRGALDEILALKARRAGAEVREAARVDAVEGSLREGFHLRLHRPGGAGPEAPALRARAVIAAHGRRGALDRSLGRPFLRRRHPFLALKRHFHGPPLPGRIELHAFPGGYCGLSEIEGGAANVCLLARESALRGRDLPPFVDGMRAGNPNLGGWLARAEPLQESWLVISQIPFLRKGPLAGDLLMAGDAAGVMAPLAGDGIAMALRSGVLAAERAEAFLDGRLTAGGLRRSYASAWRREFSARLGLGRALQALMLRPRLLSPALRLLAAAPPLGDYLVARTRGC